MFKINPIISNIYHNITRITFVIIICLGIISMVVTPRTKPKKIFLSEEEALINFALNHNQCLSYGYAPNSFEYFSCMEKLQMEKRSIVTI